MNCRSWRDNEKRRGESPNDVEVLSYNERNDDSDIGIPLDVEWKQGNLGICDR